MNRRFSNLAIFILGGAFLTPPINQMKAEASQSYIESETQQINKIVNHYSENQQQSQQKLANPTLISQNFVDAQNRIVEQFRQQTNQLINQYHQDSKNGFQNSSPNISPSNFQAYPNWSHVVERDWVRSY